MSSRPSPRRSSVTTARKRHTSPFLAPIIENKLAVRYTGAYRDRDGVIDEIGGLGGDLDGLGTLNNAIRFFGTSTTTSSLLFA